MMRMSALLSIAWLSLMVVACQDHFTTQEAYEICESLTDSIATTGGEEGFAACVACYEDCGEDCEEVSQEDGFFACPD